MMNDLKAIAYSTLAMLVLTPAIALAETWDVDTAHASAQFSVKHMMVSNVRGEFGNIKGTIEINPRDISQSTVLVEIDARTLDTGNDKRDEHLKSADFFDVTKYPKMTFTSTQVKRAGDGKLAVTGDLTMRGITKPVTLDVEGPTPTVVSPWGTKVSGVHATAVIDRKDWGLTWNKNLDAGGVVVADEVKITLDVELIRNDRKVSTR
ncbi:MAG: protein yceI precursor [Deltaproteobacteria bacterium RIFOXYA12_FULL_58_15]|nr:MAG: protein yceI precursor [Deltaproteobacteria bacterium RIFOXYA12_FULL_58_15]OGR13598.1 MAG: protein yceI precursor [Deltaproteobacteria bacterium RIFOXYB12_FULL_58_9]